MKGLDVSKHNGNINFRTVREAGYEFVIIRAGYGKVDSQKDPMFEINYKNAKAVGLKVGAYFYSYAKNASDAKTEAKCFLNWIKGKQFEMPVYFDIEDKSQQNLGKKVLTDICVTWCEAVENAGYYVGIYANLDWFKNKLDLNRLQPYDKWLAQWTDEPSMETGLWQFSSKGRLANHSCNFDLNECYKNYPEIIKKAGLNGFASNSTNSSNSTSVNHGVASCSKIAKGYKIQLNKMDLFVSSDAKTKSNTLTGFYYITDGKIINGRFRISAKKGGAVTGWIDKKYTNETG